MNFNICIFKPESEISSLAYCETAELIHFSLQALGHHSTIRFNKLDHHAKNIIFGWVWLDPTFAENLPAGSIIFNTEPIYDNISPYKLSLLLKCAARYEIWDYSDMNFELLSQYGVFNKKLFKFGYHQALSRIPKPTIQDIDILFYGSINDRRMAILNALREEGCAVQQLSSCYGAQRDAFIARSKIIVNIYFYNTKTFDIIRFFYLMSNAKAVVTEVDENLLVPDAYKNAICGSSYHNIVQSCLNLLNDDASRIALEKNALSSIQLLPQTIFTEALLAS